jgi:hypothetical protein
MFDWRNEWNRSNTVNQYFDALHALVIRRERQELVAQSTVTAGSSVSIDCSVQKCSLFSVSHALSIVLLSVALFCTRKGQHAGYHLPTRIRGEKGRLARSCIVK